MEVAIELSLGYQLMLVTNPPSLFFCYRAHFISRRTQKLTLFSRRDGIWDGRNLQYLRKDRTCSQLMTVCAFRTAVAVFLYCDHNWCSIAIRWTISASNL